MGIMAVVIMMVVIVTMVMVTILDDSQICDHDQCGLLGSVGRGIGESTLTWNVFPCIAPFRRLKLHASMTSSSSRSASAGSTGTRGSTNHSSVKSSSGQHSSHSSNLGSVNSPCLRRSTGGGISPPLSSGGMSSSVSNGEGSRGDSPSPPLVSSRGDPPSPPPISSGKRSRSNAPSPPASSHGSGSRCDSPPPLSSGSGSRHDSPPPLSSREVSPPRSQEEGSNSDQEPRSDQESIADENFTDEELMGKESASEKSIPRSRSSSSDTSSSSSSSTSLQAPKLTAELAETPDAHAARHPCPDDTKASCARCKFIVYGDAFRKACFFIHLVTKEHMSWLIEQPDLHNKPWGVGCFLCRMAGKKSKMARCEFGTTASSLTLQNLRRHGNVDEQGSGTVVLSHESALQEWVHKHASQVVDSSSCSDSGAEQSKPEACPRNAGLSYGHFLYAMTLARMSSGA